MTGTPDSALAWAPRPGGLAARQALALLMVLAATCWAIADNGRTRRLTQLIRACRSDTSPNSAMGQLNGRGSSGDTDRGRRYDQQTLAATNHRPSKSTWPPISSASCPPDRYRL